MKQLLFLALVSFTLMYCEEETGSGECPDTASCIDPNQSLQERLDSLRLEILALTLDETCSASGQCRFVGFGSKPCGGPWEYLIYPSGADTVQILDLVATYNDLDKQFNEVSERGSDCSIAIAPDSLVCESGRCIGYQQGVPFENGLCCN